jgi:GAF domain
MRKRGVGLLLILTFIIALATIAQDFRFDASLARERAAALTVDRDLGAAATTLASLRAAEAGYVAAGQGPAFWMSRATDLLADIEATIFRLRTANGSTEARAHYDAALTALTDLKALDARARGNVKSNPFVASDLIFVDALQAGDRLAEELAGARELEFAASSGRTTRLSQLRFGMNAAAIVFITLVALLAARAGRGEAASSAATTAQMLRDLPPPVKPAVPVAAATPAAPAVQAGAAGPRLSDAAELCVDLARVMDGRDLPALLERVATLLEAKGVVVWRADLAGAQLHPLVTHGYSDKVVSRLGSLAVDADNVTSLAFRSLRPQSVGGGTGAPGAIAVPLVTPSGCVGVLAAETRQSKPGGEVLSLARIVAAQLSTMISPVSDDPAKAAEA